MKEAFLQSLQNLRANKLRSFLTMFGILWGMVSVVVLSAMGEGFQVGNGQVMRELGKNIGILWGGRTSMQAGGERAGRLIFLTLDDARALGAESSMVAVVSPELSRGAVRVKSAYNAATTNVNGIAYTVVGKIRKKNQDSNYSGPDNNKIFVPFATMARDMPRRDADNGVVSDIIVTPKEWVVDRMPAVLDARTGRIQDITWPLEKDLRAILARRHGFDPDDKDAIPIWDTSLQTMMFNRMIDHMKVFFTIVGVVTLALGGIGVMNIMLIAVKERTREIGVRKALGATTSNIQRQFFFEGFLGARYGTAAKHFLVSQKWASAAIVLTLIVLFLIVRRVSALNRRKYSQGD